MSIILATALVCAPISLEIDYTCSRSTHIYEMYLSDDERDLIRRNCEFAIKKMMLLMEKSNSAAWKIDDIEVRDAMVAAIEGAIAGLAGKSPYTVIVGGCLGAIGKIGGDMYLHYSFSKEYLEEAKLYAGCADRLQERLWRDK